MWHTDPEYLIKPGDAVPHDQQTRDHVPPAGLFLSPKPTNLITVPSCFGCNNKHAGFDEWLRMVCSMPFDRNPEGQRIVDQKVLSGTMAKGRQMAFAARILAAMKSVPGNGDLVYIQMDGSEFVDGVIRITKGLLFALYPNFDYFNSEFTAFGMTARASDEQLRLMAALKQQKYFERGQKTFQCWYHVDERQRYGMWMIVFYECFGFFVRHVGGSGSHPMHG